MPTTRWVTVAAICICTATHAETVPQPPNVQDHFGNPLTMPAATDSVKIPLERAGVYLLAPLRINDREIGKALVDTGCKPPAVLDEAVLKDLHLQSIGDTEFLSLGGTSHTRIYAVDSIAVGTASLKHSFVAGADLQRFAKNLGIENFVGIIGLDFLQRGPFSLDYRAAQLTLFKTMPADLPRDGWSTIRFTKGMPEIKAGLGDGMNEWFVIDTGAEAEMVWSPAMAILHHDRLDGIRSRPSVSLNANGIQAIRKFGVSDVSLLGVNFDKVEITGPASLGDSSIDVTPSVVGSQMLRYFHWTFDLANQRVLAAKYPDLSLDEWRGKSFNSKQPDLAGMTPLMRAAGDGLVEWVRTFLKETNQVDATDRIGNRTALMYAATRNRTDVIDLLLAAGAKADKKTARGETPLMLAIDSGAEEAALRLLKFTPELNAADDGGETALMKAARRGSLPLVKGLISAGAQVSAEPPSDSALHQAVNTGNKEVVDVLIAAGAPVNATAGRAAMTPLMIACAQGHADAAEALVKAGANVQAQNKGGDAPLSYAAASGNTRLVRMLLDHGAPKEHKNRAGESAMDAAMSRGQTAVLTLLHNWDAGAPKN